MSHLTHANTTTDKTPTIGRQRSADPARKQSDAVNAIVAANKNAGTIQCKKTKPEEELDAPVQRKKADDEEDKKTLVSGAQAKASTAHDSDPYEREADNIANQVLSGARKDAIHALSARSMGHKGNSASVASKENDNQAPEPSNGIAQRVRALQSGGTSLDNRDYFESRMGYDFSNTRIHNDANAHDLAQSMGAKAFTYGNHVVFAKGQYSPHSQSGKHLLAHELTHVVQQGAASSNTPSAPQIQKAEDETVEEVIPDVAGNKNTGLVDRSNAADPTITWANLNIPRFKNRDHRGARYSAVPYIKRGRGRRVDRTGDNDPAQRTKWLTQVSATNIQTALEEKIRTANAGEMPQGNTHVFEVRNSGGQNRYYSGTLENLASEFRIPTWGGKGTRATPKFFHVDHIVELQLANWPHDTFGNDMENMELLDGPKNQESGRIIRDNIVSKINGFIRATDSDYGDSVNDIKENFTLVFEGVTGSGAPSVTRPDYWTRAEIEAGEHLNSVTAADPTKIGGPGLVRVFSRPSGGVSKKFTWTGNTTEEQAVPSAVQGERYWLDPLVITHKYFKTDPEEDTDSSDFGYLRVHVSQRNKVFQETEPTDVPLSRFIGARYGGALPDTVRTTINNLKAKYFSPVEWDQVEIYGDQGVVATGYINVSLPFFSDSTQIGLTLANGDVSAFKEFTAEDINVPAPFTISECALVASYGARAGWGLNGNVNFGIDNVGSGEITAAVGQEQGFSAAGYFDFESELFNPARLEVGYENEQWRFGGHVGVEEGIIPGVSSAQLTVNWAEDVLSGNGNIEFTYPWLDSGTLNFRHSVTDGFSLGAEVGLTSAVPGLQSATLGTNISKNEAGAWSLGASIEAEIDTARIPGLNSTTLTGEIQDGIFTAGLEAEFERDIATGTVNLGVTNQALDENGEPIEGQATEDLVFFGSGDISLQLTPWLEASAGVTFDREGSISIRGGIEVTEDIEILSDEQTPDLDVPEASRPGFDVNIPLLSAGVADVALDLKGELNAYVHTSPLILTDVGLDVYYEFDNPQATRVDGNARLHMDAQAGVAGELELGLSARIVVLRGGGRIAVTVGAELDGNIDLSVHPSWNVSEGFAVTGELSAVVQPVVYVRLDGYLYAEIDALIGSIDVWESERLNLADERVPLDILVGATAEASYRQLPNSELTYSGINWVVPTAGEMKDALISFVRGKV
ncbi:eCIS core domain-containing protein [Pseudoalteromonas sp. GB56]